MLAASATVSILHSFAKYNCICINIKYYVPIFRIVTHVKISTRNSNPSSLFPTVFNYFPWLS